MNETSNGKKYMYNSFLRSHSVEEVFKQHAEQYKDNCTYYDLCINICTF